MPHTPKKLRKLSGFDGSAEAMLQRPELAAMIAALASRATRIEDTFARLFVYLLNREEEANLAEYLKLIHRRIRMETFKEIAKGRLSEDDMTKFNKLA